MKIEFRKHYYNGKISPFANISKAFEFDFSGDEIYLTVTREHFLEEDSDKTSKLVAKAKLSELFYDVDETFFKETLFQIKSFVENNFEENFFDENVFGEYYEITFNDKTFKFGNAHIFDNEIYNELCDIAKEFTSFFNMPNKLFDTILQNKPFEVIQYTNNC